MDDVAAQQKPELSDQEFTVKHQTFMAEMEVLMKKYDVHSLVMTFGFESGTSMRGAAGALGCPGCCAMIFDRLITDQHRMHAQIKMAVKHRQIPQVH